MNNNNPLALAILVLGALSFALLPTLCNVPLLDFITGVALFVIVYIVFTCANRVKSDDSPFGSLKLSWGERLRSLPWYEIIVYVVATVFVILIVKANGSNLSH